MPMKYIINRIFGGICMNNDRKELCPRCGEDNTAHVGSIPVKVGKTRSLMVDIYVCGKCSLIFYEYSKSHLTFK